MSSALVAAALCGVCGAARAQPAGPIAFDREDPAAAAAAWIRGVRSASSEAAPRASGGQDASLACFRSLDGYSYGLGALLTLSENTIVLPSKRADPLGFYLLNADGAWRVPFPAPPARPGITNYQFELPIRFADSERRATYLMYGYSGDDGIDLHPFLVAWRDPQAGERYTKVDLDAGRSSPEAREALRETLIERARTAHEHFLESRPRRPREEYLDRLAACAPVQDPELGKALSIERAKF